MNIFIIFMKHFYINKTWPKKSKFHLGNAAFISMQDINFSFLFIFHQEIRQEK